MLAQSNHKNMFNRLVFVLQKNPLQPLFHKRCNVATFSNLFTQGSFIYNELVGSLGIDVNTLLKEDNPHIDRNSKGLQR